MRKSIFTAGLSAAIFAAMSLAPTAAHAQVDADLDPEAVSAAMRYSLPLALTGVNKACAPMLSNNGFLATNGAALVTRYSVGSEAYWPQAKALFLKMAGEKGGEEAAFMAELPDEALKPLAAALIPDAIGKEMNAESCSRVEKIAELLAPLPADNIAQLTGLIMQLMQEDEAKEAAAAMADAPR